MIDDSDKQKLIAQFCELLDDPDFEIDANQLSKETNREIDLFQLFSELVAIKNEVRLQGRHFKSAIDHVVENHTILQKHFADKQHLAAEMSCLNQSDTLKQLLLLRDRIEAGINLSHQFRTTGFSLTPRTREKRMIQSMLEGQQLSLKRLDQILNDNEVIPIMTLGRKFDGNSMNAIAMSHDPEYDDGVVSKQFRQGFYWKDNVIRLADVSVNRIKPDE